MTLAAKFNTSSFERQRWLEGAAQELRAEFKKLGHEVPAKVRVSVGWPRGARGAKTSNTIGQCWYSANSSDKHHELFISPALGDGKRILDVLAHELAHSIAGPTAGHGAKFKKVAVSIGLAGKMTATIAGEGFVLIAARIIAMIGKYPGGTIATIDGAGPKKQTTRMVKCECGGCGYIVRTTQKWIDDVGAPHCPNDGEMEVAA
jgi:hypothetical protein